MVKKLTYLLNLFLPFYQIKIQSNLIEVEALEVGDELENLFVA